ncbi:MAG TPA: sigma-70 family RNA polymerase sigma factor, partial [Chloroflexi bacterium]|nr:sigma-70 family RNA polymerase sigma factor [Chloroflexota bacterium]
MSIQTRERAKHFDRQALVDLYEEHNNALYRYAYRLLGQQDMAEDCVSEVFTRFLQIVQNGKGPQGNIRAYLYRMTHNCVVDHYRQKRTDVPIENTILKDPRPELEDDLHQKQNQEKL